MSTKTIALLLVFTPVFGMMVFAQAQDEEPVVDAKVEGEVDVKKRASLSAEEQLAESDKMIARAARITGRIRNLLNEARNGTDIILVTCLDDKYSQVNAHSRNLSQRQDSLRNAASSGSNDERNHHFTVMSVLDQNIILLGQEAGQCVGEGMFETGGGATKVVTTVNPGVPVIDPGFVVELPDDVIPVIPPPASTTR